MLVIMEEGREDAVETNVTIQLSRKFRGHNPNFPQKIGLCPQNLLAITTSIDQE